MYTPNSRKTPPLKKPWTHPTWVLAPLPKAQSIVPSRSGTLIVTMTTPWNLQRRRVAMMLFGIHRGLWPMDDWMIGWKGWKCCWKKQLTWSFKFKQVGSFFWRGQKTTVAEAKSRKKQKKKRSSKDRWETVKTLNLSCQSTMIPPTCFLVVSLIRSFDAQVGCAWQLGTWSACSALISVQSVWTLEAINCRVWNCGFCFLVPILSFLVGFCCFFHIWVYFLVPCVFSFC